MDQELLGKLLIASPGLEDIRFQDSVILICEHTKNATMGLILNKPLYNFNTSQFLKKMKISSVTNIKPNPTFFGGPVHLNQGFIIHSDEKKYKTSEDILDGVMITSSEEILIDISKDKSPEHAKIFLGCAVWDQGQLDNEILENSWIITNSSKDLIFHNHLEFSLWKKCLKDMGIDPSKLVSYSGSA